MTSRSRLVFSIASVSLVLAACGGGASGSRQVNAIPPERVPHAVAQLDDVANDILARSGIPGFAVAVVHKGQVVFAKGYGVRKLGEPDLIDVNTVFQLASVSKSIGATVVAAQVEKGLVSWDTPVVDTLPWFALRNADSTRQVTVGDFYSHQSGLPEHAGDDLEDLGFDRRQALERLRYLPVEPLHTRYAYTNFGLTAAAEAVAVAAGVPWEMLSEQELYRPLGMSATSSRYSDFIVRTNRAYPHIRAGEGFELGPQRQPDAQTAAGGVSSNVLDLAAWMNLILHEGKLDGQQFIPRDALLPALSPQFMMSPPTDDNEHASYYGYGFNVSTTPAGYTLLGHSGAFFMGAATSFHLLPAADTGIVVLTNALPVGAAEALGLTYIDLVQYGHLKRDWFAITGPGFKAMLAPTGKFAGLPFPTDPEPPLSLNAYSGTYANDYLGEARVGSNAGKLFLTLGPNSTTFPLEHWGGNVYVFEPGGEMAAPGSRSAVTFSPGPGGVAQSVSIEMYETNGVGTLARR